MATKAELEAELARYKDGVKRAMEHAERAADNYGWCDTWKAVARDIATETEIEEFGRPPEPGFVSITIDGLAIDVDGGDDAEAIRTVVQNRMEAYLRTAAGRRLLIPGTSPRYIIDDWGRS